MPFDPPSPKAKHPIAEFFAALDTERAHEDAQLIVAGAIFQQAARGISYREEPLYNLGILEIRPKETNEAFVGAFYDAAKLMLKRLDLKLQDHTLSQDAAAMTDDAVIFNYRNGAITLTTRQPDLQGWRLVTIGRLIHACQYLGNHEKIGATLDAIFRADNNRRIRHRYDIGKKASPLV